MTLSDFSIKNSVFAWMLMAALIVFGSISFRRMGVSQMPDVEFPVVNVDLTWEGAAPEVMETDVVDIVEDAITSIQGIRSISSTSRQSQADITIEFDLERDIDVALQEVQTKIAQAQLRLGADHVAGPQAAQPFALLQVIEPLGQGQARGLQRGQVLPLLQ